VNWRWRIGFSGLKWCDVADSALYLGSATAKEELVCLGQFCRAPSSTR
jgi:hypothetical protein